MLPELTMIAAVFVAAGGFIAWRLVKRRRMGNEGSADDTARIRAILAELAAARAEAAGPKPAPPPPPAPGAEDRLQQAEVIRDQHDTVDGQAHTSPEAAPMMGHVRKENRAAGLRAGAAAPHDLPNCR